MSWNIVFAPDLPLALIVVAGIAALVVAVTGLAARSRAGFLRAFVFAALILALLNPSIRREEREPIPDVAVIVVDESLSQRIGERAAVADRAAVGLKERLAKAGQREVRIVRVPTSGEDGTALFGALSRAIEDVPPENFAGAVLITDGQVHDVPPTAESLGFDAPVHTLLTGRKDERDRKLTIVQAPRFGIVGEPLTLSLRVDDIGTGREGERARVTLRKDGEQVYEFLVATGRVHNLQFEVDHRGDNVFEVEVEPGPEELTPLNNRAVVVTSGIRDRLRVLLVSGEPHAGERTWRNLLKADPSVDLVHFTILRPMDKLHWTPINELSLIEFPVRELFEEKLYEFDLIIFDRYRRRRVLPPLYLDNVARYVEKGGALLVAAGPDFATQASLYRSGLASVLPAQPTGEIVKSGYRPRVTARGARHPVTAALIGSGVGPDGIAGDPTWGRWFRLIDARPISGEQVMSGPGERPILVLDHVGKGRVAQLMSDHAWLWTRGFEGGGPQAELLRRLGHWLMKEPDLEEEDLRATSQGGMLNIRRRTMADAAAPVTVTTPSGEDVVVGLEAASPGLWTGSLPTEELGLYRVSDGTLTTVAAVGPLNPREFADMRSSEALLDPLREETGSGIFWLAEKGMGSFRLPGLRGIRPGRERAGANWMAFHRNERYVVRAYSQTPLLPPAVALLLCLGGLLLTWRREGK